MKLREFGLTGFPLSHSFSTQVFEDIFKGKKISDAVYRLFPISDIIQLPGLIHKRPQLNGLNVTIPYKETVLSFLQELDREAAEIGSVNCIKITRDRGKIYLKGYNTDLPAFRETLLPFLKKHPSKALVLGTGGAAKAVAHCFRQLGIPCLMVSRMPEGDELAYQDLKNLQMNDFHVIVNATPAGMFPDIGQFPEIPYEKLSEDHLLYDLVYNPEMTMFMKKGAENGARVVNGFKMLQLQAELSWKIWNDPEK